jgi:hypothetical protein
LLGTSGTATTLAIGPFAELDDVFLHFHAKIEALSHTPRSVAEARITSEELRGLPYGYVTHAATLHIESKEQELAGAGLLNPCDVARPWDTTARKPSA